MANAPASIKHLPLLHNPLLNSIFNNPFYATAPTKNTIRELGERHTDHTILVPPSHVLHNCTDSSKKKLADLCYNDDDFVRSHIIKSAAPFSVSTVPVSKAQLIIYDTLNGRQVLLKGGMLLTGKNFKKSVRVRVLCVSQFISFCDYFPKGSRFFLMFIEDSLLHDLKQSQTPNPQSSRFGSPETSALRKLDITFEDLLRTFPLLSKSMSQRFYSLFHHNNKKLEKLRTRQSMELVEIEREFRSFESDVFTIVQDCVNADSLEGEQIFNILDSVASKHPEIDMNQLIHEYVELNLYDKVWLQLIYQYQDAEKETSSTTVKRNLTPQLYKDLSCLSLNQLDVPLEDPWKLNILQSRITEAIAILSKLLTSDLPNQREKNSVVGDAINILTRTSDDGTEELIIDADTFIGLLIMVVVHSKIQHLEAHLAYIRYFGPHGSILEDSNAAMSHKSLGYLSYILSNFDAVVYLLSSSEESTESNHLSNMIAASACNYKFWYAIKTENDAELEKILFSIQETYGDNPLPRSHFLKSKNIHGESCFNFAVRSKNIGIFKTLLSFTEQWILFEEFVFDRNTTTNQNLLMIALQEEAHDIALEIINVIEENATDEERGLYYNSQDRNGRTVGHYLSHNLDALDRIGSIINWSVKDNSFQTPLIAMCRCYDHNDYKTLILKAFTQVFDQNRFNITFHEQVDKAGNNLLHILAKGIPESSLLLSQRALIDINQFNNKQLTPMALYIRYGRLENLQVLLQQKALIFEKEDPRLFYNVLDYYSFSAGKSSTGSNGEFPAIKDLVLKRFFEEYFSSKSKRTIGFLNQRFDSNFNKWVVNVAHYEKTTPVILDTRYVSLDKIFQFYHFLKGNLKLMFLPLARSISENFSKGSTTVPAYSKFIMNRNLEHLNAFISSVHFLETDVQNAIYKTFLRFVSEDTYSKANLKERGEQSKSLANCGNDYMKLMQSKISEICYFVEYSQGDIRRYMLIMKKFRKLNIVGGVKQGEKRHLFDRFLASIGTFKYSQAFRDIELRDLDAAYLKLEPFCLWLELCAEELLKACAALLSKISRWKASYSKIRELNSELEHLERQITADNSKELQNLGPSLSKTAESTTISQNNPLSVELALTEADIPEESSFFNFGLGDTKKSRYKKLLSLKSEDVGRFMTLNHEIETEHEQLAMSISQFLTFRSGYLTFGIKRLVKSTLVLMSSREFELRKCLNDVRSCSLKL